MTGPKIVLIGAGSMFFGRQFIWAMTNSPVFRGGTMSLVDTHAERLQKMTTLAQRAVEHSDCGVTIESSTDRREVLSGADFVVLSFADRGVYFRGVDCRISEKYGVTMPSGDTIGPGGIFRAMRELPVILEVAKDVEQLCPDAWLINYINPTTVNGIGLMRQFPNLKTFALCDGLHMPHVHRNYLDAVGGEDPDKLDLTIAGVNHFTWLLDIHYNGQNAEDKLRRTMAERAALETNEGHSKARFNVTYGLMLWDIFGKWPACMGHTKEYLPYWQGRGVLPDHPSSVVSFDAEERQKRHDEMWVQVDRFNSGDLTMDDFQERIKPDHATDIIEAMWSGSQQPFYINTANRGAVPNLPDDAFLELLCDVDMDGPKPRPASSFPRGLRSLQMQVLDTHELTVEAIVQCDHDLLRRAMLTDPIVNSISDADTIIKELLAEERDALPDGWYA